MMIPKPARTLEDMRARERAEAAARTQRERRQHVVQLGSYEFQASGSGRQSHFSGEERQVFLAPFAVDRPMKVRRLAAWFSSTTGTTTQAALALYQGLGLHTINPGSLFEPVQEFRLVAKGPARSVTGTDPALYAEDLDHETILQPGGVFAVGYQFDSANGRWFYNNSSGAGFCGYNTEHDSVALAGLFPAIIRATAPNREAPHLFVRSREGVRIRPLLGET